MKRTIFPFLRLTLFMLAFAMALTFVSFWCLSVHRSIDEMPTGIQKKEVYPTLTIVLDPGHGGEDGGAAVDGILEKELNLSICEKIKTLFALSGYPVCMTRTEDKLLYEPGEESRKKYYDLVHRAEFASSFENALFISIHQNKFEIPKYKGLQVYYSHNHPLSEAFAVCIQTNMRTHLDPANHREIKKADHRIRVLSTLEMPAVLVECGFLSNPEEAARLTSEAYQKKLAYILFLSTLQFIEFNEFSEENGESLS